MASTATAPKTKRIATAVPRSKPGVRKTAPKVAKKTSTASRVRKPKATATTITYAQFERMSVIKQIARATAPGARLAALVGLIIGGFVPVASWTLVHQEVAAYPALWVLVVGGLLYSALTVFKWSKAAFGCPVKAVGFCVLLEGILTFSHIHFLSIAALGILIFINAVSSACALQVRKEEVA